MLTMLMDKVKWETVAEMVKKLCRKKSLNQEKIFEAQGRSAEVERVDI